MRLVPDTNVVIAAVMGSGPPSRIIELATEGVIDLFTPEPSRIPTMMRCSPVRLPLRLI